MPNLLASLPWGCVFGSAAGVGWLLSRTRIQHFWLFFPRLDLLLRRWSRTGDGRTRPDCSERYRRAPGCTCAFVSQHRDLSRVHVVAGAVQLGERDAESKSWPTRAGQSRRKTCLVRPGLHLSHGRAGDARLLVSQHGNLPRVDVVVAVLQLGERDAESKS